MYDVGVFILIDRQTEGTRGLFALSRSEPDERQVPTVQRGRLLGTRCYVSVSYTHLDVYKRQRTFCLSVCKDK